jgi:hypothetical protein
VTHIERAEEYLRRADEQAKDMERNGTAAVEAYAHLALAHITFAATFGDRTSG